jgi:choline dehydrogenase-like flavoprotein
METGGDGLPDEHRQPYQRYMNAFTLPDLEHGYSTIPQSGLKGRRLPYQRGRGLGGSSIINFLFYTTDPSADWNRWAELADDEEWNWEHAKERYNRVRARLTWF